MGTVAQQGQSPRLRPTRGPPTAAVARTNKPATNVSDKLLLPVAGFLYIIFIFPFAGGHPEAPRFRRRGESLP